MTKWSPEAIDRVRQMVEAGISNKVIARRFGVNPDSIKSVCVYNGIRRNRALSDTPTLSEVSQHPEWREQTIAHGNALAKYYTDRGWRVPDRRNHSAS